MLTVDVLKYDEDECTPKAAKRLKLDVDSKNDSEITPNKHSLLDFSDDVLLIIFSSLNPEDLLSVSESCQRLQNLVHDKTLWEKVDLCQNRITLRQLKKYLKFFKPSTKFISIRGPVDAPTETTLPSISKNFLIKLAKNAPNLTTLILKDHLIDSSKVKLEDFPSSLEHLTLMSCTMTHMAPERSYFYGLDMTLPRLKSLDLSRCQWFAPHSLLALSKSTTLENLNLTACDVSECLPYASLAANFGFTTLKVLNLSHTKVSDTEVTCFNSCVTLRELILRDGSGAVTDHSIMSYGGPPLSTLMRYSDSLEVVRGRPPCLLVRLVLAGYRGITDATLRHTKKHMPHLRHLDVSNTSVTRSAVVSFSLERSEVALDHSFQDDPHLDPES